MVGRWGILRDPRKDGISPRAANQKRINLSGVLDLVWLTQRCCRVSCTCGWSSLTDFGESAGYTTNQSASVDRLSTLFLRRFETVDDGRWRSVMLDCRVVTKNSNQRMGYHCFKVALVQPAFCDGQPAGR